MTPYGRPAAVVTALDEALLQGLCRPSGGPRRLGEYHGPRGVEVQAMDEAREAAAIFQPLGHGRAVGARGLAVQHGRFVDDDKFTVFMEDGDVREGAHGVI